MSDSDQQGPSTARGNQNYLDYRKRAPRSFRALDCRVTGGHGSFSAMVMDISRSGALISVLDQNFAETSEQNQLIIYTSRVFHHFAGGITLDIASEKITRAADVVRVSTYCGSAQGINLIGIEFHEDLDQDLCDQLEIGHDDDGSETESIAESLERGAAAEPVG